MTDIHFSDKETDIKQLSKLLKVKQGGETVFRHRECDPRAGVPNHYTRRVGKQAKSSLGQTESA